MLDGEAVARRHEYLTVEHLLFALCHDEKSIEVLRACGCRVSRLKRELQQFLDENLESMPGEESVQPQETLAFYRVVQGALAQAQNAEKEEVDTGDVLAALLQEQESHAVSLLRAQGVSRMDVLRFISMNRTWTRSYQVKLALVANPKCPQVVALKFVNYLQDRDLRQLMRSKDVSQAVATHARRVLMKKGKL